MQLERRQALCAVVAGLPPPLHCFFLLHIELRGPVAMQRPYLHR